MIEKRAKTRNPLFHQTNSKSNPKGAKKPQPSLIDKKRTDKGSGGELRKGKGLDDISKKKRKAQLISKLKRRMLQITAVRKRNGKDPDSLRRSFERSPGPPPTSSIIPPPSFLKLPPYKLRSRTASTGAV